MKKTAKYTDFDLFEFLDKYDIEYTETGRNIGSGYIGINPCPNCGAENNHFGINRMSKSGNCFVCGKYISLPEFIKLKLNITWSETYNIIRNFSSEIIEIEYRTANNNVQFPTNIKSTPIKMAVKYLKKRGFNAEFIHNEYHLAYTGGDSFLKTKETTSNFNYRIIAPIIMNNKLVSYIGRDYTEQRSPKYMQPLIESCITTPKNSIYNYDALKQHDNCIIVEGITDMWKLGGKTIAVMGKVVTTEQIAFLAEKQINTATILFDEGGRPEAETLAYNLTGIVSQVKIAELEGGDPGDLDSIEAITIRTQLLN